MFASRSPAKRCDGAAHDHGRRLSIALICTLLGLALLPTSASRAQVPERPIGPVPFEDVLSASSCLMVSGRDPRFPSALANDSWIGSSDAAPPPAFSRTPATDFSRNVLVTRTFGLAQVNADPSLATDPLDPNHVILAVNALDLPSVATYTSFDGGVSWRGPVQAAYFPGDSGAAGSPSIAFGRNGTAYIAMQSFDVADRPTAAGGPAIERSRLAISASRDGGLTWEEPVSIALATSDATETIDETGLGRAEVTTAFLDRPSLVVGADPERPEREILSVAYTKLVARQSASDAEGAANSSAVTETSIEVVRSTSGGQTWSDPITVSPTVTRSAASRPTITQPALPPVPVDPLEAMPPPASPPPSVRSSQVVQGAQLVTLADGAMVVAYLDSTEDGPHQGLGRVMVATSEDGGRSFSEPVQAGLFREVLPRPRTSFLHWWGTSFPRVAAGSDGEIFIAVTARPGVTPADDGDVVLFRSLDRGLTWQSPTTVGGDDSRGTQFFPAVAVMADDALVVFWGDTRGDPSGVEYDIYASVSRDQGDTWQALSAGEGSTTDSLVSDAPSSTLAGSPSGSFLGDRVAVAATAKDVFVAWPDTRLARVGAPNLQIAFARQSPIDAPSLSVAQPAGAQSGGVRISGQHFQPGSMVTIEFGGLLLTTLPAGDDGSFQRTIDLPLKGQGEHEVVALDSTGNVASTSYTADGNAAPSE